MPQTYPVEAISVTGFAAMMRDRRDARIALQDAEAIQELNDRRISPNITQECRKFPLFLDTDSAVSQCKKILSLAGYEVVIKEDRKIFCRKMVSRSTSISMDVRFTCLGNGATEVTFYSRKDTLPSLRAVLLDKHLNKLQEMLEKAMPVYGLSNARFGT